MKQRKSKSALDPRKMGRKANRSRQHRPEREERRNKELADLKRENHRLEKQVARLRKQLEKTVTESQDAEHVAQQEEAVQIQQAFTPLPVRVCPCGSTVEARLKMSTKTYIFCGMCKKRLGEETV